MKTLIAFSIFLLIGFFGCSASEETSKQTEKKEPDVYVFDDLQKDTVNIKDNTKIIPSVKEVKVEPVKINTVKSAQSMSEKKFIIQLGAFTTKERAETFIDENKNKTEFKMNIVYRDQIKLFVVQLSPFVTREEAEKTRNNLWQIPSFKDAFIITVE